MQTNPVSQDNKLGRAGFTLIELVVIIVILGLISAVAVPSWRGLVESSRVAATQEEMSTIRAAIVGNPGSTVGGQRVDRGFEGDVGFAPARLNDLISKPDSIPEFNQLSRSGWNGPYIAVEAVRPFHDGWDDPYLYDSERRQLVSVAGPDSIVIKF